MYFVEIVDEPMPDLHRLLPSSMNITANRILMTYCYCGPPNETPEESYRVCLAHWLAECRKASFYVILNIKTMEISLTKVTTIQHRELDSWASYLNRAVDIVPQLALLYKEFLRYGKAELKNYLGDTVNCDDMPTWILRREGPGSSAALRVIAENIYLPITARLNSFLLQALICDRTEDTMQKYDRSITGLDYYDIAYANGELMLSYGILVTLAGYKADVGRFRWVGGRARPRSGTWDDIVEHMLIDLWGKKIYICKISDVTLVPDGRAATSEEEQIMAYALDQVCHHNVLSTTHLYLCTNLLVGNATGSRC
jgi:hypothetical protein